MRHTRIIVTHYGGPDAIRVVEEECPEPKNGEVRVRVLAAGVSLPDVMAREGVHPETPPVPFTPGWDLVGVVDRRGEGTSGIEPGQVVAALPIHGAYAEFVCLPQGELVPVPSGLDAAEAVSLVLNYITALQMLHRTAKVRPGQRVLIHGAAGGVGTALLQLGRLDGLEMYGTCSSHGAPAVSEMGGVPIDYRRQDFVKEIQRLAGDGVDVVFDPIGGAHLWQSRKALRPGGTVVGYGLRSSLRGEGLASGRPGRRHRFGGTATFALYIAGGRLLPGRKRVVPYSIQTLKRLKPEFFRQDLVALFDLLQQKKIKPIIARRFPLAEARQAQELLAKGGVTGKIVLLVNQAAPRKDPGMRIRGLGGIALALMLAAPTARAEEVPIVSDVLGPEGPLFVDGNLYYVAWTSSTLSKWDGKTTAVLNSLAGCSHNGLALTKQKTFLVACTDEHGAILEVDMAGKQLRRWDADDQGRKFAGGINDVVVTKNGGAYATVFGPYKSVPTTVAGKVLYLAPGGSKWIEVANDLNYANGIGISPDQRTLYVSETVGNCILKFTVDNDGSLRDRANFALLNLLTPNKNDSWWLGPDSMKIDANGNLYVAQWFGGKILKISPDGRLLHVFRIAAGDGTTNVAFGPGGKELYVTVVKDPNDPQAKGSIVRLPNVE